MLEGSRVTVTRVTSPQPACPRAPDISHLLTGRRAPQSSANPSQEI